MADIGGSLASDVSRISSFGSFSGSNHQTVFSCRWAWCRQSYFTNADLVQHVVAEHVRKSVPVRRRDIEFLRKVEGVVNERSHRASDMSMVAGGSASMQSDTGISFQHRSSVDANPPRHESQTDSLHGPPNPISQATTGLDSPNPSNSASQGLMSPSLPIDTQSNPKSSYPLPHHSPTPPFSSFASLASPSPFTGIPQIPPSPDFHSLIRAEKLTGAHPDHENDIGSEHQTSSGGRQHPRPPPEAPSSPPSQRPSSPMSIDGAPAKKPENKPPNVRPPEPEQDRTRMETPPPAAAGDSQQDEKRPPLPGQAAAPANHPRVVQFQGFGSSPGLSPVRVEVQFPEPQTPKQKQTWYQTSHLRRVSGSFTKGNGTPRTLPVQRRKT